MRRVFLLEPELCYECRFSLLPQSAGDPIHCTRRDCDNHSSAPPLGLMSIEDRILVQEITHRVCRELEDDGA